MGNDKLKGNKNFLKNHLNVWWLRPESALWDAIASTVISQYKIEFPSMDLGCGNGIFSFITAGGRFSLDYDWFRNVDFSKKDMYDTKRVNVSQYIEQRPKYKFDWGVDIKANLLQQARGLNFYKNLKLHDMNHPLPFEDESFGTIFSNILYWLRDPAAVLKEIHRVLVPKGMVMLCMPNQNFYKYCPTYRWKTQTGLKKSLMRAVSRNRYKNIAHIFTRSQFVSMAKKAGFSKVDSVPYLSSTTLKFWDIGLRPLSRPLIRMANELEPSKRRGMKKEWIDTCFEYLNLLYKMEFENKDEKGFYLFCLRKR